MSIEDTQAKITQFEPIEEDVDETPDWEPHSDEETDTGARFACQNCGRSVTKQFARVFGDNDDVIHGCRHCKSYRELQRGGGVK